MSKLKNKNHVKITAEVKDGKGYLRIVDDIYAYGNASATTMRAAVDDFTAKGVTECELYLSTRGGDVFEAADIVNELLRFKSVAIKGGALIASAGTYFCAKFHTTVKSNTQVMIHRPSIYTSGTVDEIEADVKLLKNVTADYLKAYVAKTGKSEAEIEKLWAKGDYWMTAQEAKEQGFVDAIENEEAEITETDAALLAACAAPHIPQPKIQNSTDTMKREELIAALGLDATATDADIKAAIERNKKAAAEADKLKANAAELAKTKAEAIVDAAIKDKKMTAEKRDHFVKLATADYDTTKEVLDAMQPVPKLSDYISKTPSGEIAAERKGWTLDDYLDKDPQAYAQMKEDDPEAAKRLENAYFQSKK